MKQFITILLIIMSLVTNAQDWKRTMNWYFGDKAGLSFATNPPTPLLDGAMGAIEGCAVISDTNGNLLFYTNGNSVWNRNHQLMPNGNGLLGHGSSTQAALIVPQPGNDSLFFIFTTAQTGQPNGLRFSITNMNREDGLGDITVKNILLQTPVCEKLTATKHANGKDYWVLIHGFGNDLFYAYLVSADGIVDCPVVSKIGSVHTNNDLTNAIGTMNFSSDGRKIAVCQYDLNRVELFDFDASVGTLSNFKYAGGVTLPYSMMFSLNNKYIYVSSRLNFIYQYNILLPDALSISNSRFLLYNPPNTIHSYYTALQIATDNRIYTAMVDSNFIGVINYPDSSGNSSGFEEVGVNISPKISKYGLPNFVSSYFYRPPANYEYNLNCENNTVIFNGIDTIGAAQYQWNITKTNTQTYSGNPLVYTFSDTGEYTVELLAIIGNDTARHSKQIFLNPIFSLELGSDTTLCAGQTLQLDAGASQHCYLWNDGSKGSTLTVDTAGLYFVKVVSNGLCTHHDTIRVHFFEQEQIFIDIERKADTLFATDGFNKYQWYKDNFLLQDSTLNFFILNEKGNYHVVGIDSLDCFPISSLEIIVDSLTGIWNIQNERIRVFPNPIQQGSNLFIDLEGNELISIILYDASGKAVWNNNSSAKNTIIQTSHLKKGIYILNINQIHHYKIIIH
jgi:hypothetical protein